MDTAIWSKLHGASVHFPIALVLCSWVFDVMGLVLAKPADARGHSLHVAGAWTIVFAALGSVAAVASGLLMTKGSLLGHDTLRMHHLFVWPAFALLIAAAAWRLAIRHNVTRRNLVAYLLVVSITAGLMSAAGYWGGELLVAR